jgi:tight adherence protein B
MLTALAYVSAFLFVALVVQVVGMMMASDAGRARRVNRRLTMLEAGVPRDKVFEALVRRKPASASLALTIPNAIDRLSIYLSQAGIRMSPQRYAMLVAAAAVPLFLAAINVLNRVSQGAVVLDLVVSIIGAIILAITGGVLTVSYMRTRRLKKLEHQLPLALEIVIRALRAGHPLVMAMKLAADEMDDPLGSEFGLIVDETNYGLDFRTSLDNFAHRAGSEYVHFFAVSVAIQAETGGNLAEILSNLNRVIRDQQTLHLRVAALASEGKMSAVVLTALPIVLVSFLMLSQPTFYTSKFSDPIFWPSVGVTGVVYLLGQLMINRMINFKY